MFLKKYDLFIFDWDGTLSTSSALVRASTFFKKRYNIDYIKAHKELYTIKTARDLKTKEEISKLYATVYGLYSVFSKTRLKHNAMDLLKKLKKNKKKIAIFSDSNRHRLLIEVRRLKVVEYIDLIVSANSVDSYKPDPTALYGIVQGLKAKRNRSIYIGDMVVDAFTAKFAGIDSCCLGDGLDPMQLLKKAEPTYLLKGLEYLSKRL